MSPAGSSLPSGAAAAAGHSESARQIVHISMGGFALLLRWITWPQALALAGGALLFNLFVLLPFFSYFTSDTTTTPTTASQHT